MNSRPIRMLRLPQATGLGTTKITAGKPAHRLLRNNLNLEQTRSHGMAIEPLRVGVEEAARIIGVSRSVIYKHLKAGTLRAVKDGSRTLFTMTELRAYVSRSDSSSVASTTNS
jgi:excisionase family DNA binding protein